MIKIEPILPDKPNFKKATKALEKVVSDTGGKIHSLFLGTTKGFKIDIDFNRKDKFTSSELSTVTFTDNDIYKFLVLGTKPHIIKASPGKKLVFKPNYTSKTLPGTLSTRTGSSSGDTIFTDQVRHPGTEARKYDIEIKKLLEPKFIFDVERAFGDVAKESGHKI